MPPRLTPGENLQVQQNLQIRRYLLDLHERKERNVNLWTSSLNPSPTGREAVSTETPDAEMIRRTRIVAKRSDPAVPTEGPRGCESGASTRVRRVGKRARIPAPASVNPETFAMMPESDGNLETYTELNSAGFA